MATHDCPVVHCQAMHQRRSRMASAVQLTYTSAVKPVAGETWILCTGMQPINALSFTAAFREISSTVALMKLLLAIEQHVKTAALWPPLPSAVSQTRVQQALDVPPTSHGLEWPWSYPGQSTVWSLGVMRSGRDA